MRAPFFPILFWSFFFFSASRFCLQVWNISPHSLSLEQTSSTWKAKADSLFLLLFSFSLQLEKPLLGFSLLIFLCFGLGLDFLPNNKV